MTSEEILAILPHRYPFLMIDGVTEVTPEKISAYKNVSFNEPFFQGHFPGKPIMPGVMMVEALAQAGGILAHHCGQFDQQKQLLLFLSITNAKFRRAVTPGDRLDIEVVPLRKGRVWKMRAEARVQGELAVEAELMATVAPRPQT